MCLLLLLLLDLQTAKFKR